VYVFDFTIDNNGAQVIVRREPLMGGALSDGEIDTNVRLLKENLDEVAKQMKSAIAKQHKQPVFDR